METTMSGPDIVIPSTKMSVRTTTFGWVERLSITLWWIKNTKKTNGHCKRFPEWTTTAKLVSDKDASTLHQIKKDLIKFGLGGEKLNNHGNHYVWSRDRHTFYHDEYQNNYIVWVE